MLGHAEAGLRSQNSREDASRCGDASMMKVLIKQEGCWERHWSCSCWEIRWKDTQPFLWFGKCSDSSLCSDAVTVWVLFCCTLWLCFGKCSYSCLCSDAVSVWCAFVVPYYVRGMALTDADVLGREIEELGMWASPALRCQRLFALCHYVCMYYKHTSLLFSCICINK